MPSPSDVHVNSALTNLSVNWGQDVNNFVAHQIFPVVKSGKQSDRYFVWSKEDVLRYYSRLVGDKGAAPIRDEDLDTALFSCDVRKVKDYIGEQEAANADEALDLQMTKTQIVTEDLMIGKEVNWAAENFVTGVWTTERAGVASGATGTQFLRFDVSGSDPIGVMRNIMRSVATLNGGRKPNVCACGAAVWDALADHADLLDRIKHTEKGIVTEDLVAATLGLKKFIVAEAVRNTAVSGATASYSNILGKNLLLAYVPDAPAKNVPSAGYTFVWNGLTGAGGMGQRIKKWHDDDRSADAIEGEMAYDHKIVSADCGGFLLDAVS